MVAGFGLAGYWFGTFSHTYNQATATGFEAAPYGVHFLSAGATYAAFLFANYTNVTWNGTVGPCSTPVNTSFIGLGTTGNASANELNQTGALNPLLLLNGSYNYTASNNVTLVCLNAITNGTVTYLWQDGLVANATENATGWNNISLPALNVTGTDNLTAPQFNLSYENLTGNLSTYGSVNITGCNPVVGLENLTAQQYLANCPFFVGNNQTTYLPHSGFYWNNTTSWISTAQNASETTYWHPGEYGYLPGDSVFYIAIEFGGPFGVLANMTYEVVISMGGATPIPQVFFVNTGPTNGTNETLIFAFDMSAAWGSGLPGLAYGYLDNNTYNSTFGAFDSAVYAAIDTFSATVSQCYLDASAEVACPNSLGDSTAFLG